MQTVGLAPRCLQLWDPSRSIRNAAPRVTVVLAKPVVADRRGVVRVQQRQVLHRSRSAQVDGRLVQREPLPAALHAISGAPTCGTQL